MHLNVPLIIIAAFVQRASASSIEWVVSIIHDYFLIVATLEITFHINLLAPGSIPVLGSSKNITFGFPIILIATYNFLLFPPDKLHESTCLYLSKSNSFILWSITLYLTSYGTHYIPQNKSKCS